MIDQTETMRCSGMTTKSTPAERYANNCSPLLFPRVRLLPKTIVLLLLLIAEDAHGFSASSVIDVSSSLVLRRSAPRPPVVACENIALSTTVAHTSLRSERRFSSSPRDDEGVAPPRTLLAAYSSLAPLWTTLAALGVIAFPDAPLVARTAGSLPFVRAALTVLMFAMGLAVAPRDAARAAARPGALLENAALCFGLAPACAWCCARFFERDPGVRAGLVLLGAVGGGQASNLFAGLAGGDVALSVACTTTTTLASAAATPLLVRLLLGGRAAVVVDAAGVAASVLSTVVLPVSAGVGVGVVAPRTAARARPFASAVGVTAACALVAGGATNAARGDWRRATLPSCRLAAASALGSYLITRRRYDERTRRTLVVETLSKSPTMAYVLALEHFGPEAAAVPAAAMVTLAVLGALLATTWSAFGGTPETN